MPVTFATTSPASEVTDLEICSEPIASVTAVALARCSKTAAIVVGFATDASGGGGGSFFGTGAATTLATGATTGASFGPVITVGAVAAVFVPVPPKTPPPVMPWPGGRFGAVKNVPPIAAGAPGGAAETVAERAAPPGGGGRLGCGWVCWVGSGGFGSSFCFSSFFAATRSIHLSTGSSVPDFAAQ